MPQWDAFGNTLPEGSSSLTSGNPYGVTGSGLMGNPTQSGVPGFGNIGLNPAYYATPTGAQGVASALGGSVTNMDLNAAPGSSGPTQAYVNAPNGGQYNAGNLLNIYQNPLYQGNQAMQQGATLYSLNNYYNGGPTNQAQGSYSFNPSGQLQYSASGQNQQAGPYGAWAMPETGLPLNYSSGYRGLSTGPWDPASVPGTGIGSMYTPPAPTTSQLGPRAVSAPGNGPGVGMTPRPDGTVSDPRGAAGWPTGSIYGTPGLGTPGNAAGIPQTPRPTGTVSDPRGAAGWTDPTATPVTDPSQASYTPGGQDPGPAYGGGGGQSYPSYLQNIFGSGGNPTQLSDYLKNVVSGGGNPINQTPAWQDMVAAQQRNINEGMSNLAEQFNVSGNRFSSAFGTAGADYMGQATKDQNALLSQMTSQALEAAQGRVYGASGQLDQMGLQAGEGAANRQLQAGGQLSSQDFQSQMQQYSTAAQMAAMLAQQSVGAAGQLAQLGSGAANTLYGGSVAGAQNLFGGENTAAMGMYNGQNSLYPAFMNNDLANQQMGLGAAGNLSQLWNQNLQTGAGLGQQQYQIGQNTINNSYQEWLRTQAMYNPLLQMMYGASTTYPNQIQQGYQPGALGGLLSGAGGLAGGLAMLSDRRVKDDIQEIGHIGELPFYKFRYKGFDTPQMGFMAQDVDEVYPDSVIKQEGQPWMIDVGKLLANFQEL